MLAPLAQFIATLDPKEISDERKTELQAIIQYIRDKRRQEKVAHLNFICTHNSRRSQFSQVWAQVLADFHGIPAHCYSGGVEVTACNERTIASLQRSGFAVEQSGMDENPHYFLRYASDRQPIETFSKLFDDPSSPEDGFAAIMTCSHADENCPYIPGAEARLPMRFEDPKAHDGTEMESEMYDTSSRLIASELNYIFGQVVQQ